MLANLLAWLWALVQDSVDWVATLWGDVWHWVVGNFEGLASQLISWLASILPSSVVAFLTDTTGLTGLFDFLDGADWFIGIYPVVLIYLAAFTASGVIRLIRYAMGLWFGWG